jgi:hypothetical protein
MCKRMTKEKEINMKIEQKSQALVFKRCAIVCPDGVERAGWEMWACGQRFARGTDKEELKKAYLRLSLPPEPLSYHWRSRPRLPLKHRGRKIENDKREADFL